MVRGKTQMKKIENATSRQVTFSKRRNGLLKKDFELSVLCDVEVGLIVFSPRGKLYEFSSPCMQKLLEKYEKCSHESGTSNTMKEQDAQYLNGEITYLEERIRILESSQRKMLGEDLASCSMKELNQLESQAGQGLSHIRAQKNKILVDQIKELERKEEILNEENAFLRKKCVDGWVLTTSTFGLGSMQLSEVETQLVMRPPNVKNHQDHFLVNSSL